jgi:transposase
VSILRLQANEGPAPRRLKCKKCKFEVGRDAVAVLNLEGRYLTPKGLMPLAPMPPLWK